MRRFPPLLALAALAGTAPAVVLYDNTASFGSGTRPVSLGYAYPSMDAMLYDDVNLSAATMALGSTFDVTRVTYGAYTNSASVSSGTVGLWYGMGNPTTTNTSAHRFESGNVALNPFTTAVSPTTVTLGDGVSTLFSITPDVAERPGYGRFYFGLEAQSPNVGFLRSSGNELVTSEMYAWDLTNTQLYSFTGAGNQLYLRIEGNVEAAPEPSVLAALGLGAAAALRRRRRG